MYLSVYTDRLTAVKLDMHLPTQTPCDCVIDRDGKELSPRPLYNVRLLLPHYECNGAEGRGV